MNLPIFKCIIDDNLESDLQVDYIALVDRPAIEKDFLAFKGERLNFNIDEEKRIVSGPAMIADMLIYRNRNGFEYYTVFDKTTILSIVQKFFKKGFIHNFNIQHDPNQQKSGITVFESFIVDRERGVMPMKGFEDVTDGSWFLTAKVEDDDTWEKVKNGEVKGFSVEGIFNQLPVIKQEYQTEDEIIQQIQLLLECWDRLEE